MSISEGLPLFLLQSFFFCSFEFELPFEALAFFTAGLALHSPLVLVIMTSSFDVSNSNATGLF